LTAQKLGPPATAYMHFEDSKSNSWRQNIKK